MAQVTIDAGDTRFHISLAPAMPVVELTAKGEDGRALPGASCTWTFVLDYPGFITVPQGFRRNGRAYRHPPIAAVTGNPVRVPFAIVTGGRLTATVTASVGGRPVTATREDILIGGTNPSGTDLATAVPDKLMRQMIQQESGGAQFNDGRAGLPAQAINPNWSQDNLRGVGLGQLTNPPPTADEVWNWRSNAASLQRRYRDKRRSGATLHTRITASARFQAEVAALAEWRRAEGLPPIRVSLPALTEQQQDLEGLRAYNGFGRTVAGEYLDHIHEYEPALTTLTSATRRDPAGRALTSPPVPAVDGNGAGSWTQISGAERNRRSGGQAPGDPDYVAHVLARPG
ncbi:hypothetical protein TPR58_16920 [Sphingomonas sp. HF-S3]|uniref:Uncharacterized protein n=1 Tax=Sphingomonas rustica TaxID=3103142 RepID=A0ABV0BCA8_9SPHN